MIGWFRRLKFWQRATIVREAMFVPLLILAIAGFVLDFGGVYFLFATALIVVSDIVWMIVVAPRARESFLEENPHLRRWLPKPDWFREGAPLRSVSIEEVLVWRALKRVYGVSVRILSRLVGRGDRLGR